MTSATPSLDWCTRCLADTPTTLAPLRCGHIGRLCSVCRSLRKGRPFATKAEFLSPNPPVPHAAAEGASHASPSR